MFDEEAIEQAIQEAVPIDAEQIGHIGNEPVICTMPTPSGD